MHVEDELRAGGRDLRGGLDNRADSELAVVADAVAVLLIPGQEASVRLLKRDEALHLEELQRSTEVHCPDAGRLDLVPVDVGVPLIPRRQLLGPRLFSLLRE